ncbi:MAG TPA: hypothetical protein VF441_08125 [Acidimicrobiia bacterium]
MAARSAGHDLTTGVRLALMRGTYAVEDSPNYWESRHGTRAAPVELESVDCVGAARLPAAAACQARLDQHGWGTTGEALEIIPNRDLFVFDNVIDNPSGFQSASQQFQIHSCLAGDTRATNVPSPSCADTNLVVKGNVIWNGPQSGLRPDRTARGCFGAVGQPVERRRDQLHR